MNDEDRIEQHRRSLAPAHGTATDDELRALTWIAARERTRGWARRTRELLTESPGRDLASAAIQARDEARQDAARRAGERRGGDGRGKGGARRR